MKFIALIAVTFWSVLIIVSCHHHKAVLICRLIFQTRAGDFVPTPIFQPTGTYVATYVALISDVILAAYNNRTPYAWRSIIYDIREVVIIYT